MESKNLHILSTHKISRFSLDSKDVYRLTNHFYENSPNFNNKSAYITSYEEIKEGDYGLGNNNSIYKFDKTTTFYCIKMFDCKKVILTTDQDLIKDGVQAIDDEFLKWFIKNQSCEFVEVKSEIPRNHGMWKPEYYPQIFKIIIPKENSNYNGRNEILFISNNPQCKQIEICYNSSSKKCTCQKEEHGQETLEEVAEQLKYTDGVYGFKQGAKWQQKIMYSEEEVIKIIELARHIKEGKENFDLEDIIGCTEICARSWEVFSVNEILKQFKKK